MRSINLVTATALSILMVITLVLGEQYKPVRKLSDLRAKVDLESILPARFDGWSQVESAPAAIVNPQASVLLDKLYSQVVNRVYVNATGYQMMISVAYGEDQRGGLSVHLPDYCYPAQGFSVNSSIPAAIATPYGQIPVVRMETKAQSRYEPLTYWTTVGDIAISSPFQRKKAELKYSFEGFIPDGLVFRLSSIDPDSERAFSMQAVFVNSMLSHMSVQDRTRVAGLTAADIFPSVRVATPGAGT